MKRDFVRNKRITDDSIIPLTVKVEKRAPKSNTGIYQALINVVVYVLIFLLFFKDNLQFMGLFIAFMAASVITQLIIRFGRSIKKSKRFPFFKIVTDLKLYKDYLNRIEGEIDEFIDRYNQFLLNNLFSPSKLGSFVTNLSPQIFCRLPLHADFLTLNLGQTYIQYPISLSYPNFTYSEEDEVFNRFKSDIEKKVANESGNILPYAFSLRENKSIVFANKGMPKDKFLQILNAFILDIAILQSSEEAALCFAFGVDCNLDWIRFLPHVWFGNRRLIFCDTEPEAEFIKLVNDAIATHSKYIVAFIDADFAQEYRFYDIFNSDVLPDNLSVVFFSQVGSVPSRMAHYMDCSLIGDKFIGSYEGYSLLLNSVTEEAAEELSRQLFNIRMIDNHLILSNTIPERLTFFELFGVKTAAGIPPASIEDNKVIQSSFPVKIGVGNEYEEIYIDLTNNGDGNHCLVTGTNGSGKSEFMLTYVLAACLKYRPDYFSFVAIDFKGGAMSSKIRDLPHCLGEFTNSNGNISKREVTRIAELLESEISYRESIMKDAGCADLAEYHQLYFDGKVKTALPRLLIVVDEVAVFFAKDNTAVNYITHIATVGRAVGIILLLATQSKNGIIPSQVRTNINVNVEFYSEDDNKKNNERIKGRAIIDSHTKRKCCCQVALSAIYDSNSAVVDFITISAKSRMVSGSERYTQFQQAFDEIQERYPQNMYIDLLDEVVTEPLELCIEGCLPLTELQNLYYDDPGNAGSLYPVGISDNIYARKREAFVFTPAAYNLLVFGRPQSGKTTFIKSVLVSLFHESYGLHPNALSVYIVARNAGEYANYCFPHIGNILPETELYYFLLFLVNEVHERSIKGGRASFVPVVAIIDDCYASIQQSEELTGMLVYVTSESVKYGISVILTLPYKVGIGNAALKNFGSVIAFYMGDDFDYSSLMHLDSIKRIPDIKGRCLVDIAGNASRTLETQIAYPFVKDESEIGSFAATYSDLWSGKETPKNIPLMPSKVALPINTSQRSIPVGKAKDLSVCSWNFEVSNTYLISYFSDHDAVAFVEYLIDAFVELNFDIIIVDNQRNSLLSKKSVRRVDYCQYNEQNRLKELLDRIASSEADSQRDTVLIMFDYVRSLFPSSREEKELIKLIDALIQGHRLCGVFADLKDFLNVSRNSSTRFGQYLEGVNSGMLIGNAPSSHTFGFSGLTVKEQGRPLDIGWGVNISPSVSDIKRIKIATEVEK